MDESVKKQHAREAAAARTAGETRSAGAEPGTLPQRRVSETGVGVGCRRQGTGWVGDRAGDRGIQWFPWLTT